MRILCSWNLFQRRKKLKVKSKLNPNTEHNFTKLSLDQLQRVNLEDYERAPKIPVVVVCDNLRSANNIGSIFRTCDAMAIEKIFLTGISATPPHREILKSALGATDSVEWQYFPSVYDVIVAQKKRGYLAIGVEQAQKSTKLQDFSFNAPQMLIFGNEVQGISDEILPLLDACLEIPQFGTKHSLNVAVCAGMVLWEARKQYLNTTR
jgi:23S rRNA (guanosine2251-2'-O)-methyltransferase